MNKKIVIIIIAFAIIFGIGSVMILALAHNGSNSNINIEKINSQIMYLDSAIINISNNLNNISLNENNSILNRNTDIDWNSIEESISKLYSNWNATIIEFNSVNIPNNALTNFGKILDNVTISIKKKDKLAALTNLSELYKLLITYTSSYDASQNMKNNIATKYYLIKAYSLIDTNNWTLINENLVKAEQAYYNNINSINENSSNMLIKNRTYVSIKELENISSSKDKDLFYLKYKIVMENFNKQ